MSLIVCSIMDDNIGRRFLEGMRVLIVGGVSAGVLLIGAGSRVAMLVLRITSPDHVVGVTSDDGFRIGQVTLGGTYNLLVARRRLRRHRCRGLPDGRSVADRTDLVPSRHHWSGLRCGGRVDARSRQRHRLHAPPADLVGDRSVRRSSRIVRHVRRCGRRLRQPTRLVDQSRSTAVDAARSRRRVLPGRSADRSGRRTHPRNSPCCSASTNPCSESAMRRSMRWPFAPCGSSLPSSASSHSSTTLRALI